MQKLLQLYGWGGSGLILLAFALASLDILPSSHWGAAVLNLVGAGGIVASSIPRKAYPAAFLNAVWIVIAIVAIVRAFWGRSLLGL